MTRSTSWPRVVQSAQQLTHIQSRQDKLKASVVCVLILTFSWCGRRELIWVKVFSLITVLSFRVQNETGRWFLRCSSRCVETVGRFPASSFSIETCEHLVLMMPWKKHKHPLWATGVWKTTWMQQGLGFLFYSWGETIHENQPLQLSTLHSLFLPSSTWHCLFKGLD